MAIKEKIKTAPVKIKDSWITITSGDKVFYILGFRNRKLNDIINEFAKIVVELLN